MISMRPIAIPWLRNKLPNQLPNLDQDGVSANASSPDGYGRLKDFPRIAMRHHRLAVNYLASGCLAATSSYRSSVRHVTITI
jgi:hypothetical protein